MRICLDTEKVYVTADQYEQTVANSQIAGWKLISKKPGKAVLRINGNSGSLGSHLVVGLFTLPTLGLGNLLYGMSHKGNTTRELWVIVQET